MGRLISKSKKFETLTFRLDEGVVGALRQGAREAGGSLNSLANRQLQQYAEWDRLATKMGYVTVSMHTLRELLQRWSDEEMAALGRERGLSIPEEFITFHWRTANLENFIRFVDLYAKYAHQFEVERNHGEVDRMTLYHRLGEKWSIFLEAFVLSSLDHLLGISAKVTRTENSITVTFADQTGMRGQPLGVSR